MQNRTIPINLESLIDLSARLNVTRDVNDILNLVLLTLMGKLTISNGCAFIRKSGSDKFDLVINKAKLDEYPDIAFDCGDICEIEGKDKTEETLLANGLKWLIPVMLDGETVAVFGLGKRLTDESIGESERHYIQLIGSITANALQNARSYNDLLAVKNQLEFRNLTLTTLFEITSDFSSMLSGEQIIKLLSFRIMGQLMINKFAVCLVGEDKSIDLVINRCDTELQTEKFRRVIDYGQTVMKGDVKDKGIEEVFEEFNVELIVPMKVQGVVKGILCVGKRMNGKSYTAEDIHFIESLGTIAISAMENKRLFLQELEKKKLESELMLALEIQRGFLPVDFPDIPKTELFGISEPSRHVAGDYFDFIYTGESKLYAVMADVSGKGIAASLIMANLQAALKVLVNSGLHLLDIVEKLNAVVYENTGSDKFVTFFIALFDLERNKIEYINAGHNAPLVFNPNAKDFSRLETGGLPLGIFKDTYPYQIGEYNIHPGDVIVLYTDGVTEAQNKAEEEFGEERLIELVGDNLHNSARDLVDLIVRKVKEFSGSSNLYDDITVSVIKSK